MLGSYFSQSEPISASAERREGRIHQDKQTTRMGNALVRVNGRAYERVGVIAEGGFACVHHVRRGGQDWALKWTRGLTESAQLARILLEIQVQRKLQHPNALRLVDAEVRLLESGRDSGNTRQIHRSTPAGVGVGLHESYAMAATSDHAPGTQEKEVLMLFPLYTQGTLQTYLNDAAQQQRAAFSETKCLTFFVLLVEATLELHARGFAHRDLKPGNILLSSNDHGAIEPVLMDFGSVAALPTRIQHRQQAMTLFDDAARLSSAPYRAPELWEGYATAQWRGELDGRADVWSLGCVLFAMAYGPYSPFESATEGVQQLAIFNGNVSIPRGGGGFSDAFQQLIRAMLTPDWRNRLSIQDVLHRVNVLLQDQPTAASYSHSSHLQQQQELQRNRLASAGVSMKGELLQSAVHGEGLGSDGDDWADFESAFVDHDGTEKDIESSASVTPPVSSSSTSTSTVFDSTRSHRRRSSLEPGPSMMAPSPPLSVEPSRPRGYSDPTRLTKTNQLTPEQKRQLSMRARLLLTRALASEPHALATH